MKTLVMILDPNTSEEDRQSFIKRYNEVQKANGFAELPEDWCKDTIGH